MTYESFKQQLTENLKEFFPSETNISIHQFSHNNHILLDGLTILEPNSNISPTIYLNYYFEKYQSGLPFSTIQEQILHYYYNHSQVRMIDTSFFTCFENIHSRIVYKVIHYEKNIALLKDIPYLSYLDLAIVFYCLLQEEPYKNASIPIYNHHLDYWNVSKETLLHLAEKNTPFLLPFCCDSLADLIFPTLSLLPEEQPSTEETLEEEIPMYVLTNQQRQNGACCILYHDVLKQIAEQLYDNLYILPSSIHEVIIIPASRADHPSELSHIVQEINLTEVSPEEVLSDCVYYYNRTSQELSIY